MLSHGGTTMRSNRRQRVGLVGNMLNVIGDAVIPFVEKKGADEETKMVDGLARFIALCAASSRLDYQSRKA